MSRPGRVATAGLLALGVLPGVVAAHAALVRAVPSARATVRDAPRRAQLWFSERLEPAYSTMSVWNDHARVDRGNAAVSPDEPRRLSVGLPPLDRGVYVVKYRVVSIDGHVVEGAYPFTVTDRIPRK